MHGGGQKRAVVEKNASNCQKKGDGGEKWMVAVKKGWQWQVVVKKGRWW
jgi:hypothetical protein